MQESLYLLKNNCFSLGTVPININFSFGKVCGETIYPLSYLPLFNNSAVDGFAMKIKNVRYINEVTKVFFKVLSFSDGNFSGDFSTIEIMTGARIPFNFDVVVKIEDVIIFNFGNFFYIVVSKKLVKNENIRFIGEDFYPKTILCKKGCFLTLPLITIFSSFGFKFINILCFPKIALFSTGDELKSCSDNFLLNLSYFSAFSTKVHQIFNTIVTFILNFFKQFGIAVDYYGCVTDSVSCLIECFCGILKREVYNIILSTGAVSKGKHDFILQSFLQVGGKVIFHGLKMKPGKPLLFGIFKKNCVFFGLPGNVLASIFCVRFFVFYFIIQCLMFKNYECFFSFFLSKEKNWPIGLLYFFKTHFFKFLGGYYVISSFDQESFKLNSLFIVNSFSFFLNIDRDSFKNEVVRTYCLYPSLV